MFTTSPLYILPFPPFYPLPWFIGPLSSPLLLCPLCPFSGIFRGVVPVIPYFLLLLLLLLLVVLLLVLLLLRRSRLLLLPFIFLNLSSPLLQSTPTHQALALGASEG